MHSILLVGETMNANNSYFELQKQLDGVMMLVQKEKRPAATTNHQNLSFVTPESSPLGKRDQMSTIKSQIKEDVGLFFGESDEAEQAFVGRLLDAVYLTGMESYQKFCFENESAEINQYFMHLLDDDQISKSLYRYTSIKELKRIYGEGSELYELHFRKHKNDGDQNETKECQINRKLRNRNYKEKKKLSERLTFLKFMILAVMQNTKTIEYCELRSSNQENTANAAYDNAIKLLCLMIHSEAVAIVTQCLYEIGIESSKAVATTEISSIGLDIEVRHEFC